MLSMKHHRGLRSHGIPFNNTPRIVVPNAYERKYGTLIITPIDRMLCRLADRVLTPHLKLSYVSTEE